MRLPPRLLPLAALLLCLPAARAQQLEGIRCPGENTMEMRHCAGLSLEESDAALKRRLPITLLRQWRQTSRVVCSHAYAPFREGSIHPQLVVGCEDHLNRALLREFAPLNNQGDPERSATGRLLLSPSGPQWATMNVNGTAAQTRGEHPSANP